MICKTLSVVTTRYSLEVEEFLVEEEVFIDVVCSDG
jgi:hypothetical protein